MKKIVNGLSKLGEEVDFKSALSQNTKNMVAEAEHENPTMSPLDRSFLGLKCKIQTLCNTADSLCTANAEGTEKIAALNEQIAHLDKKKADHKAIMDHLGTELNSTISEVNGATGDVKEKMKELDSQNIKRSSELIERLNQLEKETSWKISDYAELLNIRPTQSFLESSLASLEEKMRKELKEVCGEKGGEKGPVAPGKEEGLFNQTGSSMNDIYEKMQLFENQ